MATQQTPRYIPGIVRQTSPTKRNAAVQTLRSIPGIAQGVVKRLGAIPIFVEEKVAANNRNLETKKQAFMEKYGNGRTLEPMTIDTKWFDGVKHIDAGIENWGNSWIPAPETRAAEFTAKTFDAVGEAVPSLVAAAVTGGLSAPAILAGTTLSHSMGAANAFTTKMLETNDVNKSVLAAATAWGSEALGGKLVNSIAAKIPGKVATGMANIVGEGLEESADGAAYSALTGESYTMKDAAYDFSLGAAAGAIIGGAAGGINATSKAIKTSRIEKEVNTRTSDAATADIGNVQELISRSGDSPANAVVAQDSLTALKKQVANPINTVQETSNIPTDIANKYKLVPVGDNSSGKPLKITTKSYEGIVAPQVAGLSAPEVALSERASINPNAATVTNPRALYQYAPDIYLQPGTNVSDSLFTYRGQANQFYRGSQEAGAIPASGVGTSWEGSGVYSSPTPYTTDLYGPSGKLADNPYVNRGIQQKAIDADYPVGVILKQPAGLAEDVSTLTRKDAPGDVVAEGTRRIRSDDKGRGLVTEVINNPKDVSAAGLVFGRTGVAEATPVKYAATKESGGVNMVDNTTENPSARAANMRQRTTSQESTGVYSVPEVINPRGLVSSSASESERERSMQESLGVASVISPTESAPMSSGVRQSAETQTQATSQIQSAAISESTPAEVTQNQFAAVAEIVPTEVTQNQVKAEPKAEAAKQEQAVKQEQVQEQTAQEQATKNAMQIWSPVQAATEQATSRNQKRRRDRDKTAYDFNVSVGKGASGRVYETSSYNATFGGLSSY